MDLPFETVSYSDSETEKTGFAFAKTISSNRKKGQCTLVAMYGDLGVGKTAFVRGAAAFFAPESYVQSPTYTIVNEYHGLHGDLFHFDMYRIDDEDSLYSIGFWDYLERDGVAFMEWSEKIPYALPEEYYKVMIAKTDGDVCERKIRIEKIGEDGNENISN